VLGFRGLRPNIVDTPPAVLPRLLVGTTRGSQCCAGCLRVVVGQGLGGRGGLNFTWHVAHLSGLWSFRNLGAPSCTIFLPFPLLLGLSHGRAHGIHLCFVIGGRKV
jgi:hypothetical protein